MYKVNGWGKVYPCLVPREFGKIAQKYYDRVPQTIKKSGISGASCKQNSHTCSPSFPFYVSDQVSYNVNNAYRKQKGIPCFVNFITEQTIDFPEQSLWGFEGHCTKFLTSFGTDSVWSLKQI